MLYRNTKTPTEVAFSLAPLAYENINLVSNGQGADKCNWHLRWLIMFFQGFLGVNADYWWLRDSLLIVSA